MVYDIEQAYRFGTLVDALITEPEVVDEFKFTVAGEKYSAEEFEQAREMRKSFRRDPFCASIMKIAVGQKIFLNPCFEIEHDGSRFTLPFRCKYDLFMSAAGFGADIKSTACTTQKQFEESVNYFSYDRQRSVYMDLSGANQDMIIGISKVYPFRVFKVPVKKGGDLYNNGKAKYQELAWNYWTLFGNINN